MRYSNLIQLPKARKAPSWNFAFIDLGNPRPGNSAWIQLVNSFLLASEHTTVNTSKHCKPDGLLTGTDVEVGAQSAGRRQTVEGPQSTVMIHSFCFLIGSAIIIRFLI